jgi:Zn-dependent protease with chaperone function
VNVALAVPGAVTLAMIVAAAASAHRRLPPRLATRLLTIALVLAVVTVLPTAMMLALAFVAHAPVVGIGFEWCAQAFGLHGSVPTPIGVLAIAMVIVAAVRSTRLLREHRALRLDAEHPIHIADSDQPYAVTLPGPAGQIVISTAMIDLLDDDERRVVVAHERAHARYRHDRYLLAAELAAAAVPPLRALARRVRYSVERWADEAAAAACGDRRLVAATLGKVALHDHAPTVAGFGSAGVASRVAALLDPPPARPARGALTARWSGLVIAAGFSVYQLHHLERLVAALCPH